MRKNNFLKILFLLAVMMLSALLLASCVVTEPQLEELDPEVQEEVDLLATDTWEVSSPGGDLTVTLALTAGGSVRYSVENDGVTVLDSSALGFVLKEDNLSEVLMFQSEETERISGSYTNISGKTSEVEYDCNQSTLTFRTSLYYLDIIVRAYDDGYAFRYNIRQMEGNENTTATVLSEATTFRMPDDSIAWTQRYKTNLSSGDYFSYEELYTSRKSSSMDNNLVVMPMMYRAGRSDIYCLVTESGLIGSGYWGSFLQDAVEDGIGEMNTVHNIAGAMENDNQISLPFTSPWRVAAIGTIEEVVESEMVEKVYDDVEYWKPDNYDQLSEEEQAIYNYDWVDTGVSAWNWLIESSYSGVGQGNWEMQYKYLDLAAEMGWSYTILDGGWDQTMSEVTAFCKAAAEKGVKVIVWCDAYAQFGYGESVETLRNKLALWKSWGIAGIKIDFFDGQTNPGRLSHQGEDSLTIEWYEHIYQECAKLQMVVNCHGCNKPTGERRVYPNVINREAIYGNELYPASGDATVNNLFIRGSIGPTDFTPLVNPIRSTLTVGHQMALAALYECGQPSMAGRNTHYTDNLDDFYTMLFSSRDETQFLCGELDGYYCAAIRSGDKWIVAGANSAAVKATASIDFSFLSDGEYNAVIYYDELQDDGTTVIKKSTETITNISEKDMEMLQSGGFVICLVPSNQ